MLYVTTTEKSDAFTPPRTFCEDRGPDGGLFVPRQTVPFTLAQLAQLEKLSFGDRIAQILNGFFSARLTGWDVESAIGRCPVKAQSMSHRIIMAELWQNLDGSFDRMERILAEKIRCDGDTLRDPSSWMRIAIRIAVLFATYAELVRAGAADWTENADVSAVTGDFSWPMAVWYAREMGLPVANIICSCNENCALWDLLHHGELKTDAQLIRTTTPLADVSLPAELERLIFGTLGRGCTEEYLEICRRGGQYVPPAEQFPVLRSGLFASVVSRARVDVLISSVYRTNSYIMGPYTALAYGGLTDYRAKTGESRMALILAERAPEQDISLVAQAMGLSEEQLFTQRN